MSGNVADHHPAAPWTGRAAAHSSSHFYMTPCATAADGSKKLAEQRLVCWVEFRMAGCTAGAARPASHVRALHLALCVGHVPRKGLCVLHQGICLGNMPCMLLVC